VQENATQPVQFAIGTDQKNIKNKKSVGGSRAATLSTMVLEIRDRRATYSTPSELLGPATQTPTVN
jgi:hypothetical protein